MTSAEYFKLLEVVSCFTQYFNSMPPPYSGFKGYLGLASYSRPSLLKGDFQILKYQTQKAIAKVEMNRKTELFMKTAS